MGIPKAKTIRDFQAPSTDKLLARCEKVWNHEMHGNLVQETKSVKVPIYGETEEMVKETIDLFTAQDLGYEFEVEKLEKLHEDGWTTGYLVFKW